MALFEKITDFFAPQEDSEWKKKEIETKRMIDEAYSVNMVLTDQKFPQADRMYDGFHWEEKIDGVVYDRLENFSKLVYNFVADTVDRWTSFIGGTPPTVQVKPYSEISVSEDVSASGNDYEGETDEIEAVNKIVWNMLRYNGWRTFFLTLAHIQSKYGRPIIYVYFPNKDVPYPTFELLRPHDSFPVFDSRNYKDLYYIVGRKSGDLEKMKQDYPTLANQLIPDAIDTLKSSDQQRPRVTIFSYLDDKEMRGIS